MNWVCFAGAVAPTTGYPAGSRCPAFANRAAGTCRSSGSGGQNLWRHACQWV